ncbi:MAG: hypothetical protein LUG16_06535 [Candidatus Gastranaerophilales bacterium]|nr:hypothetical protein [Candidatus Gastranaerophilales bacterium]
MPEIFNDFKPVNSQPIAQSSVKPKQAEVNVGDAVRANNANKAQNSDVAEFSTNKKTKKGPIKTLKNFIANVKKLSATSVEYTKGVVKGVTTGAVAGSLVYTAGSVINAVRERSSEASKKIPNKALAIAVGVVALGVNIWNASLNATERNSNIEHRYIGHNKQ